MIVFKSYKEVVDFSNTTLSVGFIVFYISANHLVPFIIPLTKYFVLFSFLLIALGLLIEGYFLLFKKFYRPNSKMMILSIVVRFLLTMAVMGISLLYSIELWT